MTVDAFTELVGPPPGGRVYTLPARSGFADCSPSGRVRLDAIARWLQDIAFADVEDAGLRPLAVWVVRRTRIRVRRFPRFGERYELSTFCSGLGRMWAERRTTLTGIDHAGGDVEAVSLWVHLDPIDWRPARFTPEEVSAYGDAAAGRRVSAKLRHPPPPPGGGRGLWRFRSTELDIAGHINNVAYWKPLEEELVAGDEPDAIDVEIEYRTPSQAGEKLILRDGSRRWIVSDEGETHASIVVAEP